MLHIEHKENMRKKFAKLTDNDLFMLESKFRDGGEQDAAEICSELLLQRNNSKLVLNDQRGIAMDDDQLSIEL